MQTKVTDPKQVAQIAKLIGVEVTPGMAFTITSPKSVDGRPCSCGCGGATKGGLWLPGHDAKRKKDLYLAIREGDESEKELAEDELARHGWPMPVIKVKAVAEVAA